ncbi:MAG: ATP phosphoribosyltransferase [Gammaproteobacteria bacterium]|nr:ATP phosphoribosyltransferase [Gammaproteobacteria bacterium]
MALVIALNRGRILKQCLALLAKVGIEPVEDMDASRKLIFQTRSQGHKLVIMRGSDVPTYVEYGAADVGITGKDTLLESASSSGYYERLDLKIGRCRIMTAVPKGTASVAASVAGPLRVATKFVKVSRDYFERQGLQVSIIRLAGTMEIAPSMDLADCIVDLVDTGDTLKANGLEPRETIAEITSRLIVNRASMKTKFDEVEDFVEALRSVVNSS